MEVRLSNFVHGLRSILAQGCAGNLSGRLFRLLRQEAGRRLGVFVEFEDVDSKIIGYGLCGFSRVEVRGYNFQK